MDGVEAAEIIYGEHNIPVVYLTAYADDHTFETGEDNDSLWVHPQAFRREGASDCHRNRFIST